jgi:hypothetical protein
MSTLARIITSAPIDRKAAMVTARGVHWEPAKNVLAPGQARSDTPLPTRPWPAEARGQDNLTGRMVGRLTVIGLSADKSKSSNGGACWVVRCTCGSYEHRRTRSLRQTDPKRMMCSHCDHLEELKAGLVP